MAQADLADWIEKKSEELTAKWVEAVRADPRIQSDDDLSENGLRDHIPEVIEEICELLRSGEFPSLSNTREARVHAYLRFRQGYRACELVRELALLRQTLMGNVIEGYLDLRSDMRKEIAAVMHWINLYIDEEMSYAVSVYAEAVKSVDEGDDVVD